RLTAPPLFPWHIDRSHPRGYCRIVDQVPSCLIRRSPMRTWTGAVALALLPGFLTLAAAQPLAAQPDKDKLPAPGTTGNPDNVPFIGKNDPQGNPVRLAKATGHTTNYSDDNGA